MAEKQVRARFQEHGNVRDLKYGVFFTGSFLRNNYSKS